MLKKNFVNILIFMIFFNRTKAYDALILFYKFDLKYHYIAMNYSFAWIYTKYYDG